MPHSSARQQRKVRKVRRKQSVSKWILPSFVLAVIIIIIAYLLIMRLVSSPTALQADTCSITVLRNDIDLNTNSKHIDFGQQCSTIVIKLDVFIDYPSGEVNKVPTSPDDELLIGTNYGQDSDFVVIYLPRGTLAKATWENDTKILNLSVTASVDLDISYLHL